MIACLPACLPSGAKSHSLPPATLHHQNDPTAPTTTTFYLPCSPFSISPDLLTPCSPSRRVYCCASLSLPRVLLSHLTFPFSLLLFLPPLSAATEAPHHPVQPSAFNLLLLKWHNSPEVLLSSPVSCPGANCSPRPPPEHLVAVYLDLTGV